MSKDPKIIRVGDEVKIISPCFFDRCGYPMTLDDGRKYVQENYCEKVKVFINDLGFFDKDRVLFDYDIDASLTYDRIVTALAYACVKKQGFGGNEKKIYTTCYKYYKDRVYIVDDIRFVKTGVYSPGSYNAGCNYYYGGEDYSPPFLAKEQTHKILSVGIGEIECNNVEKIYDTAK